MGFAVRYFWRLAVGELLLCSSRGTIRAVNDEITDDIALEELIKADFGLQLEVKQMVARHIPVSHVAEASVFLTPKHQLFACINARAVLTLGDVQKLAKRMGLEVDMCIPPGHDEGYFNRVAREKFRQVFPGRHDINDDELHYYRTLVPYNPALLKIDAVNGGVIKQFDSHDSSEWRTAARFAYKQISTL